jgi:undecaprenyl-diphosphatase
VNVIHAIILGIVQGLTEFLPISSTAHLTLTGKIFGFIDPATSAAWTAFIAVMQLGTLAAVVIYFFRDLLGMGRSLVSDVGTHGFNNGFQIYSLESKLAFYIVAGTIPVSVIGLLFSDVIHGMFTKSTVVIISSLVALAALLWLAEKVARHERPMEQLGLRDAIVVGIAQALALIPGASRSGTTITAGLFLGFTRPAAARFSFLLSIPAVFASGVYEMTRIDAGVFTFGIGNLVVATILSAVSGYAAIHWLLRFLQRHSTLIFVWYRFGLGLLLTLMLLGGFIDP